MASVSVQAVIPIQASDSDLCRTFDALRNGLGNRRLARNSRRGHEAGRDRQEPLEWFARRNQTLSILDPHR
jgi:hypothetical protein